MFFARIGGFVVLRLIICASPWNSSKGMNIEFINCRKKWCLILICLIFKSAAVPMSGKSIDEVFEYSNAALFFHS